MESDFNWIFLFEMCKMDQNIIKCFWFSVDCLLDTRLRMQISNSDYSIFTSVHYSASPWICSVHLQYLKVFRFTSENKSVAQHTRNLK